MTMHILDQLVCCHLDCTIWSGRKKLHVEDFVLANGSQLPPADVASLGSKKICDPSAIAQFDRLKKEAQRVCEEVGIRFLGGYAFPEHCKVQVQQQLEDIAQRFNACKQQFLANYDQVIEDWIQRHPEFAESIESAITPVDVVGARLQFSFAMYYMQATATPDQDETACHLSTKVDDMGNTLLNEVAKDAKALFEGSMIGKDCLSQRALNPIRRMRQKLDGLSFLDASVAPMVRSLDELLNQMPKRGAVYGGLFQQALGLMFTLSEPLRIRAHASGWDCTEHLFNRDQYSDETTDDVIDELVDADTNDIGHSVEADITETVAAATAFIAADAVKTETTHPVTDNQPSADAEAQTPPQSFYF